LVQSGLVLSIAAGCGGSAPSAEVPDEPAIEREARETEESDPASEETAEPSEEKPAAGEPEFRDDMSVDEAIAAVPQGTSRVNLDEEALARPLLDTKLYEPCKPKPNQRFSVRVAIWDGRAVAVDVTAQPKNDTLVACVKERIRTIEWREKAKSLNTVNFNY
jgi:hypothetical protein